MIFLWPRVPPLKILFLLIFIHLFVPSGAEVLDNNDLTGTEFRADQGCETLDFISDAAGSRRRLYFRHAIWHFSRSTL